MTAEVSLRRMSMDLTDKSALFQVMVWCHQAENHFLSKWWPTSMSKYGVTRPQWVNHKWFNSSSAGLLYTPGPWFNIKMTSYQYRKSHCEDKTILRPSYLHNGISYTGKMKSLYWIGTLEPKTRHHCVCRCPDTKPDGARSSVGSVHTINSSSLY